MLNWIPLGIAFIMASIDAIVLGGLKEYSLGNLKWKIIIPIGMLVYSLQPIFFLKAFQYETMTVMNILYDVMSDIIVTSIGLLYFREKLSNIKKVGLAFGFIAIVLLSYDSVNGNSK